MIPHLLKHTHYMWKYCPQWIYARYLIRTEYCGHNMSSAIFWAETCMAIPLLNFSQYFFIIFELQMYGWHTAKPTAVSSLLKTCQGCRSWY
jgi:hypothetical protein